GDDLTAEEAELAVLLSDKENSADNGQIVYNTSVTSSVRDCTITEMQTKGVTVGIAEMKEAELVLPKIAGLAKKVHDSSPLKEEFD
ncbi:uncharacterized protein FOMMEDRAFT_51080, partial [Fomitiporia mediterranea MF3/22]|uniref:uncharacterized protein n=1 Tax=Fomitiporia mediterranea (strain MF3/22) TaxID=694068 RepID=UPI0004407FA7